MKSSFDSKKNNFPLISIIIPIYKAEKYLRFCLDSVINQTYKNLQVILINDGSPDNSEVICLEYCKKDSRFEYYHKQNEGVGATRNYGLQHIKGKFVSFLDSDDAIHPQMIEILFHLLKLHPDCSFSQSNFIRFSQVSDLKMESIKDYSYKVLSNIDIINRMLQPCSDTTISAQMTTSKLYKTDSLTTALFHKDTPGEDIYFNSHYYPSISKFIETTKDLYFYRYNPTSITSETSYKSCLINTERYCDLYFLVEIPSLKSEILQCVVRKILSTRLLENSSISKELKNRYNRVEETIIPLYIKSKDCFYKKAILLFFYYIPLSYKVFRYIMEFKSHHN